VSSTWNAHFQFAGLAAVALVAAFFLHEQCATAATPDLEISIGDTLEQARHALDTDFPLVAANNSTPGSQALLQLNRGLAVFFDTSNKVYRIQLTAPYASTLCGVKLGEARQDILNALGSPTKTQPNAAFPDRTGYIYTCDSRMSARFDFSADDRLNGIFILSGSISVPPVIVSARTNIAPTGSVMIGGAPQPSQDINGRPSSISGLEAAGQLRSTHELGCISITNAKPEYTGADFYRATKECLAKNQFDLAARLLGLAGLYGRFDAARIADKTAAGGVTILTMSVGEGLADAQKKGFMSAVLSLHDDPAKHKEYCAQIAALGPPDYYPDYLIAHGVGQVTGLDPNFDRAEGWQTLLSDGLLCSVR
jgi:hypothetical protein